MKYCEDIEGFDVSDEIVPGPVYSKIPESDEVFLLTYCFYVNKTWEENMLNCKSTQVNLQTFVYFM